GSGFDAGSDSFVDCAAAMESLDLVISSDTAIVHLAGALGVPAFAAIKSVPDWRWLLNREDSPWYPGMRLFRQIERGDWEPVFKRIAEQVEVRVTEKASRIEVKRRAAAAIAIPASVGELIDKITILEIKEVRITEADKLANVRHELSLLQKLKSEYGFSGVRLDELSNELKMLNGLLWDTENAVREHEARDDFGVNFVSLARQVYRANDQRAVLKRSINQLFESVIIEEKAYFIEK
ncbi:MAG: glycosyltransferase, partial [Beijerinckiaceae bacterium]|nr:glycosyltransferase [Beijerinckiaceae bacterium]